MSVEDRIRQQIDEASSHYSEGGPTHTRAIQDAVISLAAEVDKLRAELEAKDK